mgnify:FL=1|tara:strand:- start:1720 stop:1914 length:195 start_codon:yes stop_codon:yes gene_type:complete
MNVQEQIVNELSVSYRIYNDMRIEHESDTDQYLAGMVGLEMIREKIRINLHDFTEQQVDKILGL